MILKLAFYDFSFQIYQYWLNGPECGLFWQQFHAYLRRMCSLQLLDIEIYKYHWGKADYIVFQIHICWPCWVYRYFALQLAYSITIISWFICWPSNLGPLPKLGGSLYFLHSCRLGSCAMDCFFVLFYFFTFLYKACFSYL